MTPMFIDPDPEPTPRKQLHASWNGVPIYARYVHSFRGTAVEWAANFEGDGVTAYSYGETREIAIANLVEHLMERGA